MGMDLDTYLRENGIEGATFAALIGLTEASLSRIRRGQQNITRDTMRRIVEASEGAVTLESLVFPAVHGAGDSANLAEASTGKAGANFPQDLPASPAAGEADPGSGGSAAGESPAPESDDEMPEAAE